MPELPSHHHELLNEADRKDKLHGGSIPVEIISPLMERKEGATIFDEGEAFSGVERRGQAEAYITPVPSPHIQPDLPKEQLRIAAERVFGKDVEFPPGLESVDTMSAQLLVWWREANGDNEGRADMLHISTLPPAQQADFFSVITAQTEKAAKIVSEASGHPTIWGSWGFASPEERMLTGRGRGVPTNKHGHLHVINFGSDHSESARDSNLSASEKLNHYAPWGSLVHKEFSEPISRVIQASFTNTLQPGAESTEVEPYTEILVSQNDESDVNRVNEGYQITFKAPIAYADGLKGLAHVAGAFEILYQNASRYHEYHHKNHAKAGAVESVHEALMEEATKLGFTDDEAKRFADFTLAIRPTYSQLSRWHSELSQDPSGKEAELERVRELKELYERVQRLLKERPNEDSFSSSLIRDTVAKPEDYRNVGRTWAEHASATYVIDDYTLTEDGIQIKGLKLLPGIDSTQSAPEQMTGRILRRSTGS